tara:strand:- start:539 stop:2053 length:1515 start_codon:yes stop_codon:yes gene_type:complete
MGAKHFLPRFNKFSGTNPDIGSNILFIRAVNTVGGSSLGIARWGTVYAQNTNLSGNLLIGQSQEDGGTTATTGQITFGDDFYIAQTSASLLKIGTGVDPSSSAILQITTGLVALTGALSVSSTIAATQFQPSSANFLFYEGSPDDHETTMTITDPTADRTITFPDASGTVAMTSDIPTATTLNGSTANGLTTYASANTLDVEQYLLFTNSSNISTLELLSDQDTGDKFSIATTTHGATTISTVDDDAGAAHLTLKADGNVVIEIPDDDTNKQFDIQVFNEDNPMATFGATAGTNSYLILNEMGGNSVTDFFKISCVEHGATTISTVDGGGTQADLTISADGEVNVTSTENKINKTYDFHGTTFETTYSDDQASGTIIKYSPGSSTSLNGSEIYYLRTNGQWLQADADTVLTSGSPLLGVGLGGDPQTVGVLLKGFVRVASTEILNKPTNVPGLPLYISTTAGHFDFTAPSGSGDIVRIVGYAIDEDGGDVLVYFDPDKTYVEIA